MYILTYFDIYTNETTFYDVYIYTRTSRYILTYFDIHTNYKKISTAHENPS